MTMMIPGDLCGVFLLLARLNTSYNGALSAVVSAFEVLESACLPLKDALDLS
jgi:hypothetical protein